MEAIETLDVNSLVPFFKNQIIRSRFDRLAEGGAFIVHNNFDPRPLYYYLLVERGSVFSWKYMEEGPEVWKVEIRKLKDEVASLQIGEIVRKDYRKAKVFRNYGIDSYCGGKKILEEACKVKNINIVEVERALKEVEKEPIPSSLDYNNWDIDFLIDYIVNIHHRYVAEVDPMIHEYLQKVAEVYAKKYYDVIDITRSFIKTSSELGQHLRKEEAFLFPYIKKMAEAQKKGSLISGPLFGTVADLIKTMERENSNMSYEMKEIEFLSNNFTAPEDADGIFRMAYTKLKAFWEELLVYIHLENNVLFPKAIEMEKELMGGAK